MSPYHTHFTDTLNAQMLWTGWVCKRIRSHVWILLLLQKSPAHGETWRGSSQLLLQLITTKPVQTRICPNCKTYLSELQNIFVQTKHISPNCTCRILLLIVRPGTGSGAAVITKPVQTRTCTFISRWSEGKRLNMILAPQLLIELVWFHLFVDGISLKT